MLNVWWQSIQNRVCLQLVSFFYGNAIKINHRIGVTFFTDIIKIAFYPFYSYELFRECHSHFKHQNIICKYFHKEVNYMLVVVFVFVVRLPKLDSSIFRSTAIPFRFSIIKPLDNIFFKGIRNAAKVFFFNSYLCIGMTWHHDDDDICIVLALRLENQIYLSRSNDRRTFNFCLFYKNIGSNRIGSKNEQRTQNENWKKSSRQRSKETVVQRAYSAKF